MSVEKDYTLVEIEDAVGLGTGSMLLTAPGSGVAAVANNDALTREWLKLNGECTRLRLLHDQAVAAREAWRDRMAGIVRSKEDQIHVKNRKILIDKALKLLDAKLKDIANGGDL